MKRELQDKLYKKYPKILKEASLPVGDGWYKIMDELCNKIQNHIKRNKLKHIRVVQIKEKFGGLRFYINESSEEIYEYVYKAEEESLVTCEECGSKDRVKQIRGDWIATLCYKCAEERNEKQ